MEYIQRIGVSLILLGLLSITGCGGGLPGNEHSAEFRINDNEPWAVLCEDDVEPPCYSDNVDRDGDGIADEDEYKEKSGDGIPDEYETRDDNGDCHPWEVVDDSKNPPEILFSENFCEYGASPDKIDIFVEVDWMTPPEGDKRAALIIPPRYEALEKIRIAFEKHKINVHFDVGDYFNNLPSVVNNPDIDKDKWSQFDLGNTNYELPFKENLGAGSSDWALDNAEKYGHHADNFYYISIGYKAELAKGSSASVGGVNAGLVIAITIDGSTTRVLADGKESAGAKNYSDEEELEGPLAERLVPIMDFYYDRYKNDPENEIYKAAINNLIINSQATTIMHEIGHALSLLHGKYKPNYPSIMNYTYARLGIPGIENNRPTSLDKYFYTVNTSRDYRNSGNSTVIKTGGCNSKPIEEQANSILSKTFIVDYSDGKMDVIEESQRDEAINITTDSSSYTDWNCNNELDTKLYDINIDASSGTAAPFEKSISTLYDYDDWANLNFEFAKASWTKEFQEIMESPSLLE